jgi:hypothetical protein
MRRGCLLLSSLRLLLAGSVTCDLNHKDKSTIAKEVTTIKLLTRQFQIDKSVLGWTLYVKKWNNRVLSDF